MWYSSSTVSASLGKGGSEERKDTSGWEKRESTSALFKTGWRNRNVKRCVCARIMDGWTYLKRIIED